MKDVNDWPLNNFYRGFCAEPKKIPNRPDHITVKMTTRNILLSRKDFPHFSSKTISDLSESNNFCDVTLFCNDGHLLNAHKIILSSGSLVFNKLVSNSEQVINIDVNHSD